MSRSLPRRFVAVLLLGLVIGGTVPAALGSDGPRRVQSGSLGKGATYEGWAIPGSTAKAHVARIAARSGAELRVVQAEGRLEAGRETTRSMCARTPGCAVAINGDFFDGDGPVGAVVIDGRMLRSPQPRHEQLSLTPLRATTGGLGRAGWRGVVERQGGPDLALQGVNVALAADQLGLYTSAYGAKTPACQCLELVLAERGQPVGVLGRPATAALQRRAQGRSSLEPGTVVLAGHGPAAQKLAALAAELERSKDRSITVTLSTALPTTHNLGAHPVLLRDGKPSPVDQSDPMLRDAQPRTAVAWDSSGQVFLVVFDGRQPGGPGPTAGQALDFLQHLGATDAVLLDGGGSSTMTTAGRVLNEPSDGSERLVSNAVVVTVAAERSVKPAARRAPAAVAATVRSASQALAGKAKPAKPVKAAPVAKRVKPAAATAAKKAVTRAPVRVFARPAAPDSVAVAVPRAATPLAPTVIAAPVVTEVDPDGRGTERRLIALWALGPACWLVAYVLTALHRD